MHLSSWSPNGRWLLFDEVHRTNRHDIWALNVDSVEQLLPIATTEFNELSARFSPDDRWVVYSSEETGKAEVYVRSFPDMAAKHQVSTDGGVSPRWSKSSKEIFFRSGNTLMTVSVSTEGGFSREGTPALCLVRRA